MVATTKYDDPLLRQLRAPATDAAEFAGVLADPAIGRFEVRSLIDRPSAEVRIAIEEFLAARKADELIVVYVSCHGITDARGRLHFATTDTFRSRLASTGVDSAWVHDLMEQCRARRQVLILDCCFSGAFARGTKGPDDLKLDRLTEPGRGRVVLTASNAHEYSFVATVGIQPTESSPAPGSVFTAALLAGLRDGRADIDGDGFVTVDEAYNHAFGEVRRQGIEQTPQRWLSGGEGQIILTRSPMGRLLSPAELPEDIRTPLDSPLPGVRMAAIEELRKWSTSGDPAKLLAGIHELTIIADNDKPSVAAAARDALLQLQAPSFPAVEPGSHPASADSSPTVRRSATIPAGQSQADGPSRQLAVLRAGRNRFITENFLGGTDLVHAVSFSPDGHLLASAGAFKGIRLWNPVTAKHVRALGPRTGVTTVAFSPNGQFIAGGGVDGVRLWNPESGELIQTLRAHARAVCSLSFAPDGRLIASGAFDDIIWLCNPETGEHVRALTGHTSWVSAVAFSPDGQLLASGDSDGNIRLWNPHTGHSIRTLANDGRAVEAVAFSPDGRSLASGGNDICLWNVETGEHIRTLAGLVDALAFSPDGRSLASGQEDSSIRLWNPETGDNIRTLVGHTDRVLAVAFSPDGRLLASGSFDTTIRLWI